MRFSSLIEAKPSLNYLFTDWKDFFEGGAASFYGTDQIIKLKPVAQPTIAYVYLLKCIFVNCTIYDSGGAILIPQNSKTLSVLIEFCSAIGCSSINSTENSNYGGGFICANCNNLVINSLCTFQCTADRGQSIFASATEKNWIIQSSICSTYMDGYSRKESPIYLKNGNSNCSYLNLSNYKVQTYCAIYFSSSSASFHMNFSSIVSNFALTCGTVYLFASESESFDIDHCNILKNIDGNPTNLGTIYTTGTTTIQNCYILDNFAKYLFYSDDTTITVINCILSESYSKTGSVITSKATCSQSFTTDFTINKDRKYCIENLDPSVSAFPVVIVPFESNSQSNLSRQKSIPKQSSFNLIETVVSSSVVYLEK